jgi:multidrug efflux pump
VADINEALQLCFSGRRFGYFTLNGRQYEVIGQVDLSNRNNPDDVRKVFVPNNAGEMVSLDQLIGMEEVTNPPQLYHYNRYKSAKIEADLAPGYALKDGIQVLESLADSLLDESFSTELSGTSRDFKESSDNTLFAFLFALVLVYLVLAIQFESFKDPLVIMLTVPLALFGALFSLWAFGYTINIFSQIGIIMLIGLVTKNGILIVEFANQLRLKKGMEKIDAVIEAATMRLRPILMTSLATALGALPIALALGAGAQSRKPLGMAIIGGIMFSLILTLYVVPAMYAYLSGKQVNNPEKLPDEAEA